MAIVYHDDVEQGSEAWHKMRCGLLTASEMKLIITPSNLKPADNDKTRAHVWELAAQRRNKYVEPSYIGDDMLRGREDEVEARILYDKHYAPVTDIGFVTNDRWGFTIGCSPDGLVGDDGGIESKSRKQKLQFQDLVEQAVPTEHIIQVHTSLVVTERAWWDYNSYCGGMPMMTLRVYPDPVIANAIVEAAGSFERKVQEKLEQYEGVLKSGAKLIPTERKIIQEMI